MDEIEKAPSAPETKKCPFCARDVLKEATRCEYCKEWLDGRPPAIHSNARRPLQFFLMYLCSFGLYHYWWAYKNWQQLKIHRKLECSPGKRTLGMMVPFLGYFFLWLQFNDINTAAKESQTRVYAENGILMAGMIALNAIGYFAFNSAYNHPIGFFIGAASMAGLAFIMSRAQLTLNDLWSKEQPGLPTKKSWSAGQAIVILIGGLYYVLLVFAGLSA